MAVTGDKNTVGKGEINAIICTAQAAFSLLDVWQKVANSPGKHIRDNTPTKQGSNKNVFFFLFVFLGYFIWNHTAQLLSRPFKLLHKVAKLIVMPKRMWHSYVKGWLLSSVWQCTASCSITRFTAEKRRGKEKPRPCSRETHTNEE